MLIFIILLCLYLGLQYHTFNVPPLQNLANIFSAGDKSYTNPETHNKVFLGHRRKGYVLPMLKEHKATQVVVRMEQVLCFSPPSCLPLKWVLMMDIPGYYTPEILEGSLGLSYFSSLMGELQIPCLKNKIQRWTTTTTTTEVLPIAQVRCFLAFSRAGFNPQPDMSKQNKN